MSSFPRRKKYDTYKVKHQEHLATSEQLWERIAESLKRVEDSRSHEDLEATLVSPAKEFGRVQDEPSMPLSTPSEQALVWEKETAERETEIQELFAKSEERPFKFLRRHCDPANSLVEELKGKKGLRANFGRALENKWTHLTLMFLLVVDIVLVGAEFIINSIHCHKTEKTLEYLIYYNATSEYHPEKEHKDDLHHIIHIISIGILLIFLAHLILLILAFGRKFFYHIGYVFDLTVISIAVGIELAFDSDLYSLLIVTTFWRVIRIAHGIYMVTEDSFETKTKKLKGLLDILKRKHTLLLEDFKRSEIILSDLQKENNTFRLQYQTNDF